MNMWDAVILAIVQGITEFLPVSSSGQLLAMRVFFDIPDVEGTAFDAYLHLGTLIAVLIYYWRVWIQVARGVYTPGVGRDLVVKLAVATIPAGIAGYALHTVGDEMLRTSRVAVFGFIITAAVLFAGDKMISHTKDKKKVSVRDSMWIGFAQMLALMPGISRSGITIAAGRWCKLSRKQSMHFSFLLSAPIIAGAGLVGLPDLMNENIAASILIVSVVVSCIVGMLTIHGFLKLIERVSFLPFVIYLLALSAILVIFPS